MATWERYRSANQTGFETVLYSGQIFTPRSYCDDPTLGPVGIYVAKAPVCKLLITPTVQFANVNVAWDISQSSSATSTIDTFDIAFGGGGPSDLSSQDWSSDPKTGNVQYTSTGRRTITASVTDLLGAQSNECKITIDIVDYVSLQRLYIGVTGTSNPGCYILTPSGGPTQANTGLTGNHPNFRMLKIHPAYRDLPVGQQHLWAATEDGVAYTTDGATSWTVIGKASLGTPANNAGDSPAPAATDLELVDLAFDPQDPRRVYVVGRTTATPRTWLYVTDDYGANWSNYQVSL